MKWNLKNIVKETSHPFLNFYTLKYEVDFGDHLEEYSYFLASRHEKEDLLPFTHDFSRPDGVLIVLYLKEENNGHKFLLSRQFRPAIGSYVYSFPAGLMDKDDSSILETAIREAKEEAGATIKNLEIICKTGSCSSGMSDETNAIVLGEIDSIAQNNLEEFEDISARLYSKEEVKKMLKDDQYFFADVARLALLYLLERFR